MYAICHISFIGALKYKYVQMYGLLCMYIYHMSCIYEYVHMHEGLCMYVCHMSYIHLYDYPPIWHMYLDYFYRHFLCFDYLFTYLLVYLITWLLDYFYICVDYLMTWTHICTCIHVYVNQNKFKQIPLIISILLDDFYITSTCITYAWITWLLDDFYTYLDYLNTWLLLHMLGLLDDSYMLTGSSFETSRVSALLRAFVRFTTQTLA